VALAGGSFFGRSPPVLARNSVGAQLEAIVSRTFSMDPYAPTAARLFACDAASSFVDDPTSADLGLLVSELVTNSVVHGGGASRVRVDILFGKHIRVEVVDFGEGFEFRPHQDVGDRGGFGLVLVQRIAESWGMTLGDTTRVWFELPRHSTPEAVV
jgi:two-component sensor histidine kinase